MLGAGGCRKHNFWTTCVIKIYIFGILALRAINWYIYGSNRRGGRVRGGPEFFGPPLQKFTGSLLQNFKHIIGILSSSQVNWHPF